MVRRKKTAATRAATVADGDAGESVRARSRRSDADGDDRDRDDDRRRVKRRRRSDAADDDASPIVKRKRRARAERDDRDDRDDRDERRSRRGRDRDDDRDHDRDRDDEPRSRRGRSRSRRARDDRDDDRDWDRDDDRDRDRDDDAPRRSRGGKRASGRRSRQDDDRRDDDRSDDDSRDSGGGRGRRSRRASGSRGGKSSRSGSRSKARSSRRSGGGKSTPPSERKPTRPPAAGTEAAAQRRYAPGEGKAGRRILISTRDDQEDRVAVVAEDRLEEFYVDRVGDDTCLGNIYLGRVVNIEPSIGAAFIDYGEGKNGFLHASDVAPVVDQDRVTDFLELAESGDADKRPDEKQNIDELLKLGDSVVVQVTKQGIGQKGATLTTYVSIPGCYLVLMPNLRRTGVSRKIADEEERKRLKEILQGFDIPEGLGFIIRTAGEDHPRQDLERDGEFLLKMWNVLVKRLKTAKAPACLYRESDLILRSVRDLFTPDTEAVVIDTEKHYNRCLEFTKNVMPQYADRVQLHDKPKPLFTEFDLDGEVEKIYQRKIQLKNGASIVLDQTEALVAIDVNSGKNKEETDLEETALRTNVHAIPEIVRQLRLRDLGGLVIIDFIDMSKERHRRRVERAMRDELRKDRARFRMEGMSMFGIIELTRQRVRPSLFASSTGPCPACHGLGTVKRAESVSHTILRRIRGEMTRPNCAEIEVRLFPEMASFFQNARRKALMEMEDTFNKVVRITPDAMLRYDELRLIYHERVHDLSLDLEHYL